MADDLEEMWRQFLLTEEEQLELAIAKEWVDYISKKSRYCLLGKIVMRKNVNMEAMKMVFVKLWKIKAGISIREVGERLFIFQFEDEVEKDRVLQKQPWSFNKSLLVLKEINGDLRPEEVNMEWCPFTVQVHGLPLGLMTKRIGVILGEVLGDVLEVETDDDVSAWGKFLKIRVALNITKPLKRGKMLSLSGGGKVLARFKYERLSDFCYVCGRLDL